MATLYENLGGQTAWDAFVPALYDKVLTDDGVSSIFRGVGMERQGRMLHGRVLCRRVREILS